MKKTLKALVALFAFAMIAACGQKSTEERIKEQITEKVHALSADERLAAQTNAKQFYEKEFPQVQPDGSMARTRGFFNECRPTDSNANGLVSCFGKVPNINGGYADVKRYCGYRPEVVGCSDEDTVK